MGYKYLTIITPLVSFAGMETILFFPRLFWYAIILVNSALLLSVFALKRKYQGSGMFIGYIILPLGLFNSVLAFSLLINSRWIVHALFVISSVLGYLYYRYIYYFMAKPHFYIPNSIENFSTYCDLLVIFWMSSAAFGFQSFLSVAVWKLSIVSVIAYFIISYHFFWANHIKLREAVFLAVICGLLMAEIFWAASFLPFNFVVVGFMIAVYYYVTTNLIRLNSQDRLTSRKVKYYLFYSTASLVLVLLFAQWI